MTTTKKTTSKKAPPKKPTKAPDVSTAELYGISGAPTAAQVQASLEDQLVRHGADIEVFRDLICDYVKLYVVKDLLQRDIAERGVSYRETGSTGITQWKQNKSVPDLVQVNRQMLAILKQLDLSVGTVITDEGEDDGL